MKKIQTFSTMVPLITHPEQEIKRYFFIAAGWETLLYILITMPRFPTKRYARSNKKRFTRKPRGRSGARPTRYAPSRRRLSTRTRIVRTLRSIAETKYIKTNDIDYITPFDTNLADSITCSYRVLAYGADAGADYVPLGTLYTGGITIPQGIGGNQRIGDHVYLKTITSIFTIDMAVNDGNVPLHNFRVVALQPRQSNTTMGSSPSLRTDIFLDNLSDGYGFDNLSVKYPIDVQRSLINKRKYRVFFDKSFILSAPDSQNSTAFNSAYKSSRTFKYSFPIRQDAKFVNEGNNPSNINSTFFIMIIATGVGSPLASWSPNAWSVSQRGTTAYTDM